MEIIIYKMEIIGICHITPAGYLRPRWFEYF